MKLNHEGVHDIVCDICSSSTRLDTGLQQFGTLKALWGPGSGHDGQRYEVHLCELCFFQALANLKHERRTQNLFSEDNHVLSDDLGLVKKAD